MDTLSTDLTERDLKITELQLFIVLAQSLARVERQLTGQATQQTLSIIDNSLALIRRAESDLTIRRNETKKTKNHFELNGDIPHL
jgi:hypothetical protein